MEWKATHVLKCGCCKDWASWLFKIESTVAEEETDEVVVPDPDDLVWNDWEDEETLKDPDDVNTKPRTYKEQIEFLDELWVKEHRRKDDNSPKVEASVQKIYEEYK